MLDLEFMRIAFAVGAVVGVLAPAVGFFLVERRQSLVGDGLGHVAFAGVAAGYLLDVSPVLTALAFAVTGALAIEWLRSRGGTAGDQALALVFYTGIALGIVLVSAADRLDVGLFQFLFGSILTVTWSDLWVVLALGLTSLGAIALLYRGLVGAVLDEEGSRVAGVRVGVMNTIVAVLAALTVGISMRIVGILLIAALMVLPVIAAQRVAWSLRSTMALSILVGLSSVLAGLTISYYANLPPGGTIVLTATGFFLAASAFEAVRARVWTDARPRSRTSVTPIAASATATRKRMIQPALKMSPSTPPRRLAAMPIRAVVKSPMFCRPGRTSRPRAPMSSPVNTSQTSSTARPRSAPPTSSSRMTTSRTTTTVMPRTLQLRRQRARVGHAALDPLRQLVLRRLDAQPACHRAAAHDHLLRRRRLDEPRRLLGIDAHQDPALAAGGDGHVAVEEEGQAAEHLLRRHAVLAGDEQANPVRELLVVRHLAAIIGTARC